MWTVVLAHYKDMRDEELEEWFLLNQDTDEAEEGIGAQQDEEGN